MAPVPGVASTADLGVEGLQSAAGIETCRLPVDMRFGQSCSRERTRATLRSMDAQWVGVALTAIAVVVSLAVFIRSGSTELRGEFRSEMQSFRQEQREEIRVLAAQQREDNRALAAQQREDNRALSDKLTALAARQREDHRELSDKLTALAERTTRIEEALVPRSDPVLQTAAQSLPPTE